MSALFGLLQATTKKMTMSQYNTTSDTNNGFDFLRLCAAYSVLFAHHFDLTKTMGLAVLGVSLGGWGVATFFALSGYLVTGSYLNDPHFGRFMARRALRIFPALIVCVLITVICIGPWMSSLEVQQYFAHPQTWQYLKAMVLNIKFTLPGVFVNNPLPNAVNDSLWTIRLEFKLYLYLGVACWLLRQHREKLLPALLLISVIYYVYKNSRATVDFHDLFPLAFFVGMAIHVLSKTLVSIRLSQYIALALIVLAGLWLFRPNNLSVMMVWAGLILVIGKHFTIRLPSWFRTNDVSYGIYLYAFPIQQIVYSTGWHQAYFWLTLMLIVLITTVLAYLSCKWVEQPAMRFKPKR